MSPEMWSELDSLMQAQSLFIRGLKVFRAIMLREFDQISVAWLARAMARRR